MGNLLVSSASRKNPLVCLSKAAVRRATGGQLVSGDRNPFVEKLTLGDSFWRMPETKSENFDSILEGCLERRIKFVLPTRDSELEFWSSRKLDFKSEGINVIISSQEAVRLCLDKLEFYRQFARNQTAEVIETQLELSSLSHRSIVVKERFGSGSQNLGIGLTKSQALTHARALEQPIFQPEIVGREISVDAYFNLQGRCSAYVTRDRLVVIDGESQVTRTFSDPNVDGQVEAFLKAASEKVYFFGPVVLQAIVASDSRVHIIEINARFGGASTLSDYAGLHSIYWAMMELNSKPFELPKFPRRNGEIELRRLVVDTFTNTDSVVESSPTHPESERLES